MSAGWEDLTFQPDERALAALANSWSWLLQAPYHPILFSSLGDMFFRYEPGDAIHWLNTGTGEIVQVANGEAEFMSKLGTIAHNEWFMPELVEKLRAAGKRLPSGYCYTYVTLPIFAEGKYDVANINPVPGWEHFKITGEIHRQLRDFPEGSVRFIVD